LLIPPEATVVSNSSLVVRTMSTSWFAAARSAVGHPHPRRPRVEAGGAR
jgi:hypothetical protein